MVEAAPSESGIVTAVKSEEAVFGFFDEVFFHTMTYGAEPKIITRPLTQGPKMGTLDAIQAKEKYLETGGRNQRDERGDER